MTQAEQMIAVLHDQLEGVDQKRRALVRTVMGQDKLIDHLNSRISELENETK